MLLRKITVEFIFISFNNCCIEIIKFTCFYKDTSNQNSSHSHCKPLEENERKIINKDVSNNAVNISSNFCFSDLPAMSLFYLFFSFYFITMIRRLAKFSRDTSGT